jgi:hypothetical protein
MGVSSQRTEVEEVKNKAKQSQFLMAESALALWKCGFATECNT